MRQPAVTVLDRQRDSLFLAAGQLEYLERSTLSPGDAIVVCAVCRSVYYAENWRRLQGVCACCAGQSTIAFRGSADALLRQQAVRPGANPAPPADNRAGAAPTEDPTPRHVPLAALRHLLSAVVMVAAVTAVIVLTSALGEAWRDMGPQRNAGRAAAFTRAFARQLIQGDGLADPRNE